MTQRFLPILGGFLFLASCVPLKRYQALEAQQKILKDQLGREREELSQLQGIRYSLESQLQTRTAQLAQAGQAERERLAALTQQYNTLVAEHNQLADHYARLKVLYDSTQREHTEQITQLEERLGTANRAIRTSTRGTATASKARRRRRR